jgi:hypothetical protein
MIFPSKHVLQVYGVISVHVEQDFSHTKGHLPSVGLAPPVQVTQSLDVGFLHVKQDASQGVQLLFLAVSTKNFPVQSALKMHVPFYNK